MAVMRWTCPRGHEQPFVYSTDMVRDMVGAMALSHQCADCATHYLLPREAQHRVLQCVEQHALEAWLNGDELPAGGFRWRLKLTRLRLIARFPPDAAEVEAMADAGDTVPRVRVIVRVDLATLRSAELLKRKLRSQLEQRGVTAG